MVTYIILHYNRPYFLDLLIQSIRKYFHPDPRIVVLDDGSDPEVLEALRWMQIDELVSSDIGHRPDSCCHMIRKAQEVLRFDSSEYVVWSEDDFLLLSNPVNVPPEQAKGEDLLDSDLCPKINCKPKEKFWEEGWIFWDRCREILDTDPKTLLVQVSRPIKPNVKYCSGEEDLDFRTLDHKRMPKYYYTNWPYMCRKEDFLKLIDSIPDKGNVERFEFAAAKFWNNLGGKETNYIQVPRYPRYIHIGYSFSQQPANNKNPRRMKSFGDLQKLVGKSSSWVSINQLLCAMFVDHRFRFRLDRIESRGLGKGMRKAIQKAF